MLRAGGQGGGGGKSFSKNQVGYEFCIRAFVKLCVRGMGGGWGTVIMGGGWDTVIMGGGWDTVIMGGGWDTVIMGGGWDTVIMVRGMQHTTGRLFLNIVVTHICNFEEVCTDK